MIVNPEEWKKSLKKVATIELKAMKEYLSINIFNDPEAYDEWLRKYRGKSTDWDAELRELPR